MNNIKTFLNIKREERIKNSEKKEGNGGIEAFLINTTPKIKENQFNLYSKPIKTPNREEKTPLKIPPAANIAIEAQP
jgi:hypothetical protein